MIIILTILILSFALYFFAFRGWEAVVEKPDLGRLVFFREYLVLTIIPYAYYLSGGRFESHYILFQLGDDYYFQKAAMFAFVFILVFVFFYAILRAPFEKSLSKVGGAVSDKKVLFLMNLFLVALVVYFVIVTYHFKAGIYGIFKYDLIELTSKRAQLSRGGSFLSFNKIIIKGWIPMLSYLYFYYWLTRNDIFHRNNKIAFFVSIILSVLASIWYFEKSVIAFYCVGLLGVYVFTGNRLRKKTVFIAVALAFLMVSLMYIIVYQDKIVDISYLYDLILHRVATQSVGSVMSLHYFESNDFLYLSGVSNILSQVQGDSFNSVYSVLIDYYVPKSSETSGSLSSFVTGDAYGLFGFPGVLISGVVVAVYYSFFEGTKSSKILSICFVGLYGNYFSHFYVASSFYAFLWPVGLAYKLLPFVLISVMSLKYRK